MIEYVPMMILLLSCFVLLAASEAGTQEQLLLENKQLALHFDPATGRLRALQNKLAVETYQVNGDGFAVEAVEFRLDAADVRLVSLKRRRGSIEALYHGADLKLRVTYTLGRDDHFAEKRVTLTSDHDCGLKKVTLSQATFIAPDLDIVCYRYPQFGRLPGTEPICTYFGRTPKGGFFTGVELPYDASALSGRQVSLAYAPSLKVKAGEELFCEPVYFGVYERHATDDFPSSQPPMRGPEDNTSTTSEILPLPSESDAMVAMTSAILGQPRHGLVPMACGWHCEMEQYTYADTAAVEADMRSLDVIAECGIDWVSDSHPWGGETEKMNALAADQKYEPGPLVRRFLEHARKTNIKVVMWPTMDHTHPWWNKGGPFRSDKPEWLMTPRSLDDKPDFIKTAKANCFANAPFFNWLSRINNEGLATGYYKSWAMDGSFFGDGGWFTSIIPVDCASDQHDHLPGDSNYACERALAQLIAGVRHQCPDTYIFTCRPPMDLGVWSLRNVDACFTLLETGTGSSNVAAGDAIRKWSRVRVHHHFFPHYMDQPLLFPSRANRHAPPDWPSEKLDYILISALSCSPNQLFYLPTKTGIPDKDKDELRTWLAWGRTNIAYLKVRKDLPDWPGADKVDGSAHLVGDCGLVFLFNPSKDTLSGEFALTDDCIGLKKKGTFRIDQEYPESSSSADARFGDSVRWEVPAESVVVLRVRPAGPPRRR